MTDDQIKNRTESKNNRISVLLVVLIFFGLGFWFGNYSGQLGYGSFGVNLINSQKSDQAEEVDLSLFWQVWDTINERHISAEEVSEKEKVWGAIHGLLGALDDPHTVFMEPRDSERFAEDLKGRFGGVGMEVGLRDDTLTVIAPLKGTPAEKAGLQSGDKILAIGEEDAADLNLTEAVDKIRGPEGTDIKLTILREGETEPLEKEVTRAIIDIPIVDSEELDDGIFKIEVYSFTGDIDDLFFQALQQFKQSDADKLIIDLRNNAGGLLTAAINMMSHFTPSGTTIVKEKYTDPERDTVYRSRGFDTLDPNETEVVILVNQGSASASEIVTGAFQDHDLATIIGEKTFGKGTIQDLKELPENTTLKMTIAEWLTPEGRSFDGEGLEPDIEVEMEREDIEAQRDPQLDRAVEYLRQ